MIESLVADPRLLAELSVVFFQALWLLLGLRDNILHPELNRAYTDQVLDLTLMRRDYPEAHAHVAHRRIVSSRVKRLVFLAVVVAEAVVTILLAAAAIALFGALFEVVDPAVARSIAMLGCAAFASLWAGFLCVGNHFCYWFCHQDGQKTHFLLMLWGLGGLVLLAR